MAGFISALIKQRRDAKKACPDTSGRLKEIIDILRKYDYDDGITPEIVVGIIQDLGPTFVKIGQIASQQSERIPPTTATPSQSCVRAWHPWIPRPSTRR